MILQSGKVVGQIYRLSDYQSSVGKHDQLVRVTGDGRDGQDNAQRKVGFGCLHCVGWVVGVALGWGGRTGGRGVRGRSSIKNIFCRGALFAG